MVDMSGRTQGINDANGRWAEMMTGYLARPPAWFAEIDRGKVGP